MRFGLLNLLIAVVFISGLLGCWLMPGPWVAWKKLPETVTTHSIISPEHDRILSSDCTGILRLYSFPELNLIWIYKSQQSDPHPSMAFLGNPAAAVQLRYSSYKDGDVYERLNISDATFIGPSGIIPAGEPYSESHFEFNGETYTLVNLRKLSSSSCRPEYGTIYRARYPNSFTGHFHRPEVWVTILSGLALLIQFFRARKLAKARA